MIDYDEDEPEAVDDELLAEQYDRDTIIATGLALTIVDALKVKDSALRSVLDRAVEDAKAAVRDLIRIETTDPAVRELQWRVTRFDDLCKYVSQILAAGREATADMAQSRAESLRRLIEQDDGEPKD